MPTTINIKNIPTGYQSIISNGRHSILGDEPVNVKGTDLGFSPAEFIAAGLAMCKVATVRNVARRKGWEIGDVDAQLIQEIKRLPGRKLATTINTKIKIEGDLTDEQKKYLIDESDNCYVQRMVTGEWTMNHAEEWDPQLEEAKAE